MPANSIVVKQASEQDSASKCPNGQDQAQGGCYERQRWS